MRPWDTFSAREADDFDYGGLTNALKPDWELLDRHYWREDFRKQYGHELDDDLLDRHAELASAALGVHPEVARTQHKVAPDWPQPRLFNEPTAQPLLATSYQPSSLGTFPGIQTIQSHAASKPISLPDQTALHSGGPYTLERSSSEPGIFAPLDRPAFDQSNRDSPFQLAASPPKSSKGGKSISPPAGNLSRRQQSPANPPPEPEPPLPFWAAPILYGLKYGQFILDALSGSKQPLEWHTAHDRIHGTGFNKWEYRLVRDYLKEVAPNSPLTAYHTSRDDDYQPSDDEFDEMMEFLANVHDAIRRGENGEARGKGLKYRRADVGNVRTYVSDDLFDPDAVFDGVSNRERISRGHSPIGHDGISRIVIHHIGQNPNVVVELTEEAHKALSRYYHTNPRSMPSNIFRPTTDRERNIHWKYRAEGIPKPGAK